MNFFVGMTVDYENNVNIMYGLCTKSLVMILLIIGQSLEKKSELPNIHLSILLPNIFNSLPLVWNTKL